MQLSVIKNAKRNMLFGIANKLIVLLCPFITQMMVKHIFGIQYIGLKGLFDSILNVLSLSELGFGSAIIFFMYKPLSKNDTKEINALLNLYKRVCRYIGVAILLFGISVMPFIDNFINGDIPDNINIYFIYTMYLINSVMGYFLYAYMSPVIIVNQRDDINSTVNSLTLLTLTVSQIIILRITKNYYFFVVIMLIFTIINNLWIAIIVKKQFPTYRAEGNVSPEEKNKIKKVVAGAFIQRCCGTTRNSIDSICISSFIGISLTGIYNNYYMVIKGLIGMQSVFNNSILGGIGNHVATKSVEENFQELKRMDFVFLNVNGWCTIFLLCLYQPFMTLWMGSDALLPFRTVILLCVYYYVLGIGVVRYMYMETNGLYWEHRWRSIVETAVNVVLNILLGKYFGIDGIILATMISLLSCNFIWANRITFEKYFGKSYLREYYMYQFRYLIINLVAALITYFCCTLIHISTDLLLMLFRIVVCILIPGTIYLFVYNREIKGVKKYL